MEQIQTKTFLEGYAKFNEQYLSFQNDMLKNLPRMYITRHTKYFLWKAYKTAWKTQHLSTRQQEIYCVLLQITQ